MYFLTVEDIIKVSNAKLLQGDVKTVCKNFSKDTRIIEQGDVYIGIKGEKFDGSNFWEQALEKFNSFTTEMDNESFFAQLIHKEIDAENHTAEASMRQNHKGWGSDFFTYITIEPIYGDY